MMNLKCDTLKIVIAIVYAFMSCAGVCYAGNNSPEARYRKMYTEAEKKVRLGKLPKWCLATEIAGFSDPNYQRYKRKYPKSWIYMHHYCYCLNRLLEAEKSKFRNNKKDYFISLKQAKGEAEFVIPRVSDNFPLKPSMLNQYGNILAKLGNLEQANKSFMAAIRLRPNYPEPYYRSSQLFLDLGLKQKAIEILQRGVKACPENKSLKRELSKLFE